MFGFALDFYAKRFYSYYIGIVESVQKGYVNAFPLYQ